MVNRFGHYVPTLSRKRERVGERVAFCLLAVLVGGCAAPPAIVTSPGPISQPTQPPPPAPPAPSTPPTHTAFDNWLAAFRQDAAAQGISPATLDAALTGMTPIQRVIELDGRQPEFLSTFAEYLAKRVTESQVARGQAKLAEHATLLDAVEKKYGVPRNVLVAFWGLETHFGTSMGTLNVPASLATLAWDGRRSAFFRSQLLDALRIIDAGHVAAIDMNGSWAGAMGHMQFMPSTFRAYAVDGDGDARIDLWQSLPDAMNSAANYLQRAGWHAHEPVALEVRLPAHFDWRQARLMHRLPVSTWMDAGVQTMDGTPLPKVPGRAAIVLPQGRQGPAFMVFDNFDVVMDWNRSVNYALSVALFAQQLVGGGALVASAGEPGALSTAQMKTLQQNLNALGFNCGKADGLPGLRTQTAIRLYQVKHQLPADGYASPSLFAHIEQTLADAGRAGTLIQKPAITFADPESPP